MRTLVLPRWENVPLAEVDFTGIRAWVTDMAEGKHPVPARHKSRKLKASRVIQAHQILRWSLDDAVRMRLIPSNPAVGVKLPRKDEAARRYLTHAEVDAVATNAGDYSTLVYVLAYTGVRFGEVTALRVKDFNPHKARLTVSQSVTRVSTHGEGTRPVLGTPKGRRARSVPIPAFVVSLLIERIKGTKPDALLFPGAPLPAVEADGLDDAARRDPWLSPETFRWAFDKALGSGGIDPMRPHDLRHTAASLAIASGASV